MSEPLAEEEVTANTARENYAALIIPYLVGI